MPIGAQTMKWGEVIAKAAEAPSFQHLEPGTYELIAYDALFKTNAAGVTQFHLKLMVDSPAEKRGQKDTAFYTVYGNDVKPAAVKAFMEAVAVFGLDTAFFATEPSQETVVNRIKNQKVLCEVVLTKSNKPGDDREFTNYRFKRNLGMASTAPLPAQTATPAPVQTPAPVPVTPDQTTAPVVNAPVASQADSVPSVPEAPATPSPVAATVPILPPMI